VTFYTSPFSSTRLAAKPANGSIRPMAQNAQNLPKMCLLGMSNKIGAPPPSPQILEILHYESRFFVPKRINVVASATKFRGGIEI